MILFSYQSGEEVKEGDKVLYHGEPGEVEFVITGPVSDPAMNWYLDKFPGGGFMVTAKNFGRVFLTKGDINEDLTFVSRRTS